MKYLLSFSKNITLFCLALSTIHTFAEPQNLAHIDAQPELQQGSQQPTLLIISSSHSNPAKVKLLKKQVVSNKTSIANWQVSLKSLRSIKSPSEFLALINQNHVVLLDSVSEQEADKSFKPYLPMINQSTAKVVGLKWHQAFQKPIGVSEFQRQTLDQYWDNGGGKNLGNMLRYLSAEVLNDPAALSVSVPPPVIFPSKGIYHPKLPNLIVNDLKQYFNWQTPEPNQPKIALLMNRSAIEVEQTELIDTTIEQFEQRGVQVVPFFFALSRGEKHYDELLYINGRSDNKVTADIDLILNFRNIHWANQRKIEFERFGVPVIQAMTYYGGDQKAWEQDPQGVDAGMMAFTLVLPETAGVTDPMVVAAMDRRSGQVEIIDYQLEHLVNKAVNLINLKYKPAGDKKITVFVWGDQDVGASFLNIPTSLSEITKALNAEGYDIPATEEAFFTQRVKKILDPFYRPEQLQGEQLQAFLDEDLAELMPIENYLRWFDKLPSELKNKIDEHWGKPQDNFMAIKRGGIDYFVLPRMRVGNMLVMRQPPRSDKKNDESGIFHQGIVPINHFYLAAYFYAREFWQGDAIVHLGTHGSQEYLGGKERGLSIYDQGNLAVWDTPVVYPFIVDDVGEAMQTKRRGRATVVSHMTPPFAAAGLQGDIVVLHELMHQYSQLDDGGVKQKTAKHLVEQCFTLNVCKDIGWEQTDIENDFDAFFDDLHSHMEALATANQPLGLHTFGQLPETRLVVSTLIQMLGSEFSTLAQDYEHDVVGLDFGNEHNSDAAKTESDEHLIQTVEIENIPGFYTVLNYVVNAVDSLDNNDDNKNELPAALFEHLKRGQRLYQGLKQIRELQSLTDFLAGRYIPVKTGGDPIRHPESLPTGFNLYGFDPAKVPTKAAYEQGKELINQMVSDHQAKHGKFPDKMAFSLWSIETMRHYGVLESQALYAMGVRPIWSETGRVLGSEIIPYSELKRPRIDVVLSATGLYRDAFPNVMQRLAKAVQQVAELKEDNNPIWKNSQRVKAELLAQGVAEDDAEYLSTVRVFSNQSGDYGSGVDGLAWASDKWENDSVIADNYMNKMGFYFGADKSRWGKKIQSNTGEPINLYGKQLSGTDIALFSRSSNVFGMLSSDDPFEYFGGISLAVRNLDGASPDMVVSNLRDANHVKAEDASRFLARELRTRIFHPRWIKEMQKEGYSGAVSLSSRMDNFFGWQVVDPNLVRSDQWDEYLDVYVDDKLNLDLDEWFEKTNPEALARMMQRMLEAQRKDYWQASDERLETLVKKYSEYVEKYSLFVDNEKLKQHVTELAVGFGLSAPQFTAAASQANTNSADIAPPNAAERSASEVQQVKGQKLELQPQASEVEPDNSFLFSIFGVILIILGGMFYEVINGKMLMARRP